MIRSTLVNLSVAPVLLPTNGARAFCLSQPYVGTSLAWPVTVTAYFKDGETTLLAEPGVVYDFGEKMVGARAFLAVAGSGTYLLDVADGESSINRPNASPGDAPPNVWQSATNPDALLINSGNFWERDWTVPQGATGGVLFFKVPAANGTPILDLALLDDQGVVVAPYGYLAAANGKALTLGATTILPAVIFGTVAPNSLAAMELDGALKSVVVAILPDAPPRTVRTKVTNTSATVGTPAGVVSLLAHWWKR